MQCFSIGHSQSSLANRLSLNSSSGHSQPNLVNRLSLSLSSL
jgi:hypothetical protein